MANMDRAEQIDDDHQIQAWVRELNDEDTPAERRLTLVKAIGSEALLSETWLVLKQARDALIIRSEDPSYAVRRSALKWSIEIMKSMDAFEQEWDSGKVDLTMLSTRRRMMLGRYLQQAQTLEEFQTVLDRFENTTWDSQRTIVLKEILSVLKDGENPEIKQAAADWLGERAQNWVDLAKSEYFTYKNIVEALEEARRLTEGSDEYHSGAVNSIRATQHRLWESIRQLSQANLKIVRGEQSREKATGNEDVRATAIYQLTEESTLGSREAVRELVEQWVEWIEKDEEPHLVELTSDYLRYNRYAVLSLIEQFGKRAPYGGPNPPAQRGSREAVPSASSAAPGALSGGRSLEVRRRIARQLADMSNPAFFGESERAEIAPRIQAELQKHAVPVLARLLRLEDDDEIRENIGRMLGYTGGQEAIDALIQSILGDEKKRNDREDLLSEYYLKPAMKRSDQAADILNGAIHEAKHTLRLLQGMNMAALLVGLIVLGSGLLLSIFGQGAAAQVLGGASAFGGFAWVIAQLIRAPLDRIQDGMANLVQLETAFISFIWGLNLNGTYIQSRYVAEGRLHSDEIKRTLRRIEKAVQRTMNLVHTYTAQKAQRLTARIHKVDPPSASPEMTVTVHGQFLFGDSSQKKDRTGMVAVNHKPLPAQYCLEWKQHQVRFQVPPDLSSDGETQWISLFVDGMETNALPFQIR